MLNSNPPSPLPRHTVPAFHCLLWTILPSLFARTDDKDGMLPWFFVVTDFPCQILGPSPQTTEIRNIQSNKPLYFSFDQLNNDIFVFYIKMFFPFVCRRRSIVNNYPQWILPWFDLCVTYPILVSFALVLLALFRASKSICSFFFSVLVEISYTFYRRSIIINVRFGETTITPAGVSEFRNT